MGRKLNRIFQRNSGWLAVIGLVLTAAVVAFPEKAKEVANSAAESDWLDGLTGLLGQDAANLTAHTSYTVYVKYNAGTLEQMGLTENPTKVSEFSVTSTTTSTKDAKFVLKCGTTTCGQQVGDYEDPLTVFVVQVPNIKGLSSMIVTAGTASLEIKFG